MSHTNHLETKIRSAFRYHGGKSHLARRIIDLITDHTTYLEPFAGAVNVLLNKYRAPREVICDLSIELIHFYQFLVQNTDLFMSKILEIPYSLESFLWAKAPKDSPDSLERALRFFVRQNMSRGGIGLDYSKTEVEGNKEASWKTYQDDLPATADRLRGVEIRLQSAFDTLEEFKDDHKVLTYLDPPYYPSTRVTPQKYTHELTAFEHLRLLKKIKEFSGQVILSGYANPLYDQELADWDRYVIPIKNHSSQKKSKPMVEEILWVKSYFPF